MQFFNFPNPDIETHLRVLVIDVHKESAKTKYTLLVMKLFGDFLGALRTCAIMVFSISRFGNLFFLLISFAISAKTPYEIIAQAPDNDWRDIDNSNTLYIQLETGTVVVELAPKFAPIHVSNTKKLVKEGIFDNTNFYRVIDGFVAQGGPLFDDSNKIKQPKTAQLNIAAEFTLKTDKPLNWTAVTNKDGYAAETGFYHGFAVGRSKDQKTNWLLHCYAAFAMGRGNEPNTGGTELYIINGNAQRYLDRNTTVFGRVVVGMEHIQALKRSQNIAGKVDLTDKNKILSIKVASDIAKDKRLPIQIMKTDSASFKALIQSRKNRNGQWFVYQHNYIDACSIPVPVRLNNATTTRKL
ncbi:MAG TPA: peptidylprolyl isomerase [Oceanospirillales bacterium]|nr:peptidylprolyl isomerase [Oceanospirillales bacterium]